MSLSRVVMLLAALGLAGCFVHAETPARAPGGAEMGLAPPNFDTSRACTSFRAATKDAASLEHDSFPELSPEKSCFVAVRYGAGGPRPDPTPQGCGYPRGGATIAALSDAALHYERIASGVEGEPLPIDLACELPEDVRRAAAAANARTMRNTIRRIAARLLRPYPYGAVATFGYGHPQQGSSPLVSYRPGDACPRLGKADMDLFSVNVVRAGRAAEAWAAGVAPVVTVSGGAVHSKLVEAFLLQYLAVCVLGVPATAVLLDPCADHTHTNIRNTGSLVRAIGGRTAYLVTDDGLQSGYLEEWTSFDLIGGSIDQRSLRDFGYLLGSWRRASIGMPAGFWYTPFRFWAEPETKLGSFTCAPP